MRAGLALRQAKQMGRRRRSNRASGPLSWAAVGWDGGGDGMCGNATVGLKKKVIWP